MIALNEAYQKYDLNLEKLFRISAECGEVIRQAVKQLCLVPPPRDPGKPGKPA